MADSRRTRWALLSPAFKLNTVLQGGRALARMADSSRTRWDMPSPELTLNTVLQGGRGIGADGGQQPNVAGRARDC